jgi:hypothetical protein
MKTKTKARKIIQIAVSSEEECTYGALFALCDDGTLWQTKNAGNGPWHQVPPVPVAVALRGE